MASLFKKKTVDGKFILCKKLADVLSFSTVGRILGCSCNKLLYLLV